MVNAVSTGEPAEFTPLEREAYDWMMKFASNKASEGDLSALQTWLADKPEHRAVFEQLNRVWDQFGSAALKISAEDLSALEADRLTSSRQAGRRAVLGGGATAAVLGLAALGAVNPPLGLWPSWAELHASYRTVTGEQSHVTLADGIAISMNTRTSIAMRSNGEHQARIELIAGEAVIATPQGGTIPCTVMAATGRVLATTARFNIWRDDRAVCVTCLAGEVAVHQGVTQLMLLPNQQVTYGVEELGKVETVDPEIVTSWLSGVVVFRLTPVSQVIEVINRYRPGKVILTDAALGHRLMNARFRVQDVDGLIGQIQQVFGAQVTTLPGGVILLG